MTLEQAGTELNERGLMFAVRTVTRDGEGATEYAVVRRGGWPANTAWFALGGDSWHGLRWHPTWEWAYAESTGKAPF